MRKLFLTLCLILAISTQGRESPDQPPRTQRYRADRQMRARTPFPARRRAIRFEAIDTSMPDFHLQIINGEKEENIIAYLSDNPHINVNQACSESKHALFWAIHRRYAKLVLYLLERGANVNVLDPKSNRTPLDIARISNNKEITQILESHGGLSRDELPTNSQVSQDVIDLIEERLMVTQAHECLVCARVIAPSEQDAVSINTHRFAPEPQIHIPCLETIFAQLDGVDPQNVLRELLPHQAHVQARTRLSQASDEESEHVSPVIRIPQDRDLLHAEFEHRDVLAHALRNNSTEYLTALISGGIYSDCTPAYDAYLSGVRNSRTQENTSPNSATPESPQDFSGSTSCSLPTGSTDPMTSWFLGSSSQISRSEPNETHIHQPATPLPQSQEQRNIYGWPGTLSLDRRRLVAQALPNQTTSTRQILSARQANDDQLRALAMLLADSWRRNNQFSSH